jgi:hypothetical protein
MWRLPTRRRRLQILSLVRASQPTRARVLSLRCDSSEALGGCMFTQRETFLKAGSSPGLAPGSE